MLLLQRGEYTSYFSGSKFLWKSTHAYELIYNVNLYIVYVILLYDKNLFYVNFILFNVSYRVSGATVIYSYLGEFVNNKYREKFLCWMEMFWTGGIITLPCNYKLFLLYLY